MQNIVSKWGAIVIVMLIVGTLLLSLVGTASSGFSTLFSDSYIPVKMLIIEKYPARIIIVGEYRDIANYATEEDNNTKAELTLNGQNNVLKLVDKVFTVPNQNGTFDWDMNFNFNNQFNTKQVRSTHRANQVIVPQNIKE